MSIVSSSYTVDAVADAYGRRIVHEAHTDSTGRVHRWSYLAAPDADMDAILAQHASATAAQLAEAEANELMGS